jgi:hypothetical protein
MLPQTVVAVIIWKLDLQLPVQSVPITTKVVSLNPVHGKVYLIQHYVIKLKVALNTINLNLNQTENRIRVINEL